VRDAVICEPLRTPVGGFGGSLRDVPAQDLASTVIRALLERTGLPPESVDDVLLGHCYPTMDAPAIGRVAALDAGLPVTASGLQIDRRCGSGLQAVIYAALQVQSGTSDVVLAGGAESMSNAPFYSTAMRWGVKAGPGVLLQDGLARGRVTAGGKNHPVPGGMLETAENLRREYEISREEQDEYAVRSHQRAAAATDAGRFADEIVPVTVSSRKGDTVVDRDEHIRPDSSVETLAKLRPIMGKDDPEATVTAGNASGQNDGAAVCVVTSPEKAAELGLRPLARLVSFGVGGVPPRTMGIGPVPATAKALSLGSHQRQRLGHLARAPGGGHRRPDPRHAAARDGPPRRPLRPGDHVHRRRPGPRRGVRAGGLVSAPNGRVAIVTGAARGIGAATAQRLAADGLAVAVLDLSEDDARATVEAVEVAGGRAIAVGADVGDAGQVQAAVDRIAAELGPPTVLVNNAGVTRDNLLFKMSDEDWDLVMHVHLRGSFLMTRAVQKHMVDAGWGRVVNLSSTSALGNRGQANYATAKAGLQGFTKTLAIELGRFGVTANAIAPGFIVTDMTKATAARLGQEWEPYVAARAAAIPVARAGQPVDIAHTVSFLVSEGAGFISGQVIYVAGGPRA
jgi:acetyl-CoA C-acetyltransferase